MNKAYVPFKTLKTYSQAKTVLRLIRISSDIPLCFTYFQMQSSQSSDHCTILGPQITAPGLHGYCRRMRRCLPKCAVHIPPRCLFLARTGHRWHSSWMFIWYYICLDIYIWNVWICMVSDLLTNGLWVQSSLVIKNEAAKNSTRRFCTTPMTSMTTACLVTWQLDSWHCSARQSWPGRPEALVLTTRFFWCKAGWLGFFGMSTCQPRCAAEYWRWWDGWENPDHGIHSCGRRASVWPYVPAAQI